MNTGQELLRTFILEHSTDAAEILEQLDIIELRSFFDSISDDLAVALIQHMGRYRVAQGLEKIDPDKAIRIMGRLPGGIAQVLLRMMEQSFSNVILKGLPAKKEKSLSRLLSYHQHKVGANIETEVFTVYVDMKVSEVLEKLKDTPLFVDSYVIVTGRDQKLEGTADIRELVTTDDHTPIRSVLSLAIPGIAADRDLQSLAEMEIWANGCSSLPVVDADNVFLGLVYKDVVQKMTTDERSLDRHSLNAAKALGELFRIGLTGLAQSAGDFRAKNIPNQNV